MARVEEGRRTGLLAVVREAASNRDVAGLQLASIAWGTGEAAYVVGLTVVTYEAGGTGAVAVLAVIRALPSVLAAPILTAVIDRLSLGRQLRLVVTLRIALVAMLLAALALAASSAIPLAIAGVDAVLSTLLRPIRGALGPALARTPDELVASNVALTTGDSLAALVGPALAALLLLTSGTLATFAAGLALLAIAGFAAFRVRVPSDPGRASRAGRPASEGLRRRASMVGAELAEGVRELGRRRNAALIVGVFVAQRFVRGMFAVLAVAAAVDLLGLGLAGVGWLGSAIGLGGLAGGLLALRLVGGARLVPAFAAGVVLWGLGFALPGIAPIAVVAVLALAASGVGKVVLDVAGFTLLQRTVPADVRGPVLGALEGFVAAALALGSLAAAWLVDAVGAAGAMVVAGAIPIVAVVLAWLPLRGAEDAAVIPRRELAALRHVTLFRPLGLNGLERLAAGLRWARVDAGQPVVREGEPGDRFYVVESGAFEVSSGGRAVRRLGAGDSFGEIALLRTVPRTATVTALDDGTLAAIDGPSFLAAITGHPESAAVAASEVADRLATERQAAEECRINERLLAAGG